MPHDLGLSGSWSLATRDGRGARLRRDMRAGHGAGGRACLVLVLTYAGGCGTVFGEARHAWRRTARAGGTGSFISEQLLRIEWLGAGRSGSCCCVGSARSLTADAGGAGGPKRTSHARGRHWISVRIDPLLARRPWHHRGLNFRTCHRVHLAIRTDDGLSRMMRGDPRTTCARRTPEREKGLLVHAGMVVRLPDRPAAILSCDVAISGVLPPIRQESA